MDRPSILLIISIICVIGTQGRAPRQRSSNSNVNTNYFRRSANSNVNTNTFAREVNPHGGQVRQTVPSQYDMMGHMRGADDNVTKCLVSAYGDDVSEDEIEEVAEAVLEIMGEPKKKKKEPLGKRQKKLKRDRDIDTDYDAFAIDPIDTQSSLIDDIDGFRAGSSNFNSNTNRFGPAHVDDGDVPERRGLGFSLGYKRRKGKGSRGKPNRARYSNYNENTNSFRRSFSGDGEDDGQEAGDIFDKSGRRRGRGRSSNSNINSNVFRRNLNRNVNFNGNSDRRWKG